MTNKQSEALALRLADWLEKWARDYAGTQLEDMALTDAADELRRLHEANEAFGKRQEWWNDRMVELEQQRDELLTTLKKLEYSSDGYIKRYPEEAEVNAVIAKAEGKQ